MKRSRFFISAALMSFLGLPMTLWGAGSGLNVAIVVNQNSTNSVQLGNYLREARQIPPQNVIRINWTGGNIAWSTTDFTNALLNPFLNALASRKLDRQIDYVVLSMDIPYRVFQNGGGENSTSAALSYGFKADSHPQCSLADGSASAYAGSEGIFRNSLPINSASNQFLVTMITGDSLALALRVVDHGVYSDSTFPTQPVYLAKTTDLARNVRFFEFDNAIFNTRLRGNYLLLRTNLDNPYPLTNLLGYQNGTVFFSHQTNAFIPGSLADNLTSFGAQLFENPGQTTILSFLAAGAAGAYGTVTEPCNYLQKFPDPQNYYFQSPGQKFPDPQNFFFQSRGFSLAECFYLSLNTPYQGLVMGEPLAAPFARSGTGAWRNLPAATTLSGVTNLHLGFTASDISRPLQSVDLFVDGNFVSTIANLGTGTSDVLTVTLNQQELTFSVPSGASLLSVASGLAGAIGNSVLSNQIVAVPFGDRIELRALVATNSGTQLSLSASSSNSSGQAVTQLAASRTTFLDSIASGFKQFLISTTVTNGSYLQLVVTKTNGSVVTVNWTNTTGNTDLNTFVQQFANQVNTTPALTGTDGVVLEDVQFYDTGTNYLTLRASGTGLPASGIKAVISGSPGTLVAQTGEVTLSDNLADLQPRNHLYVLAGKTNLDVTFPLDTSQLADGYHQLTAVAYEGTHVRTQTRAEALVRVQNTGLSASLNGVIGGTNSALEATLQFAVQANTNTIALIQLFGTGGVLVSATNQATALFSIPASSLGLGLHPFYALVTDATGKKFRTQTLTYRLIGLEAPFQVNVTQRPTTLVWLATAGRRYEILRGNLASGPFTLATTLTSSNNLAQWVDPSPPPGKGFYRIRSAP